MKQLKHLDMAADALLAHDPDLMRSTGGSGRPPKPLRVSRPDTWKAWQLPQELIGRFFSAAAAYYRAAPWKVVSNSHAFTVRVPGGYSWTVSLLGNAGMEFGIVLYEQRADLVAVLTSNNDPHATFARFAGAVISLSFEKERDLPPPMAKEVRRAGWEVASPKGWPYMFTYNSIAGGVTARNVEDLTAILAPLSAFVSAHSKIMLGYERTALPRKWSDSASGVEVQFDGVIGEEPDDTERLLAELSLAGASGPGALPLMIFEPGASWDGVQHTASEVVEEFDSYLASGSAGGGAAKAAKKHRNIIELFVVHFLAGAHQTPLPAINEYDLRVFLYDWLLRKASLNEREYVGGLTSLRYFFEFIDVAKGIECRWAAPILRDREMFLSRLHTRPEGMFWDEAVMDWRSELNNDLHARVFLNDQGQAGGIEWGYMMGPTEAGLAQLLERLWLKWRDEIIAQGERDPEKIRAILIRKQHEFERTAPTGKSETPAMLIAAERKSRAKPAKREPRPKGGKQPGK